MTEYDGSWNSTYLKEICLRKADENTASNITSYFPSIIDHALNLTVYMVEYP